MTCAALGLLGALALPACRSEQMRFAAGAKHELLAAAVSHPETAAVRAAPVQRPQLLALGLPAVAGARVAFAAPKSAGRFGLQPRLTAAGPAKSALRPVSYAMKKQLTTDEEEKNRPLNGVLLLVPVLALLALVGVSLGVAAVFSISFWPALGWTALAIVGALLLALAVAILRGK